MDKIDVREIKICGDRIWEMKKKLMVVPYDPRPVVLQRTTPEEIQVLEHKGDDKGLLHVLPESKKSTSTSLH